MTALLDVNIGDRVLDAGCGRAAFLIDLLRTSGGSGTGVDIDEDALAAATSNAGDLAHSKGIEFVCANLRERNFDQGVFAVGICLGSTHAFADGANAFPLTVQRLKQWTAPGGVLLIGDCFWAMPPEPEYVQILGDPVGIYRTHDENIAVAEAAGLHLKHASCATREEWDRFEADHLRRAELAAANTPDDAGAASVLASVLERRRAWYAAYEKWGRATLGFGFYIFETPL